MLVLLLCVVLCCVCADSCPPACAYPSPFLFHLSLPLATSHFSRTARGITFHCGLCISMCISICPITVRLRVWTPLAGVSIVPHLPQATGRRAVCAQARVWRPPAPRPPSHPATARAHPRICTPTPEAELHARPLHFTTCPPSLPPSMDPRSPLSLSSISRGAGVRLRQLDLD